MTQHIRTDLAGLAAQTEAYLDSVDPATLEWENPVELRRVSAASERLGLADAELRSAVTAARAVGRSWTEVGVVLGVSKQAAQQRFGR